MFQNFLTISFENFYDILDIATILFFALDVLPTSQQFTAAFVLAALFTLFYMRKKA